MTVSGIDAAGIFITPKVGRDHAPHDIAQRNSRSVADFLHSRIRRTACQRERADERDGINAPHCAATKSQLR
jgi:hypothetical protein